MEILNQKIETLHGKTRAHTFSSTLDALLFQSLRLNKRVRAIGINHKMDDYEKRKLAIFNQLNFLQLITGAIVPLFGMIHNDRIPDSAWIISCLPALTSIIVLLFNYIRLYFAALFSYFILYPFLTSIVYLHGMNSGVALNFILYGVLSVFFLQDIGYMLFSIALSMVSYIILAVVLKHFQFQVEAENTFLFFLNQVLALGFIFYGLFLIKKENTGYQFNILKKNRILHQKKLEIEQQKEVIGEKARLLEIQRAELSELNTLKNKLFSVISHDLKSPMYAVRNLFKNMYQYDLPAEEIKTMVPDVLNDLNYTISLMENLLQWAKSQMAGDQIHAQEIEVSSVINEVIQLLHLQADAKQIWIQNKAQEPVTAFADNDMVNLVIRNLLSNAIKFTPPQGVITLGVNELPSFVEVFVQDSGTGISPEALARINENNYYTTKGTASESGTGLGLMLCKEFLTKNGGKMHIESELGKGSTFSFTLPRTH